MPLEFEEHLLSAYLDNELSADERALVEQRLKTDPAAQQLFEDLKRVRNLVATLPGWQGSELNPALADAQPAVEAAEQDTEPPPPNTLHKVEYSTSLAETRLRERDKLAGARTRRSMRWTTIVAVAAGLATLMLAVPYFFRPDGDVLQTSLRKQRSDSATAPPSAQTAEPSSEAAVAADTADQAPLSESSGPAAGENLAERSAHSKDGVYYRQEVSEAAPPAAAYGDAAGAAPSRMRAKSMEGTADELQLGMPSDSIAAGGALKSQLGSEERQESDAAARGGSAELKRAPVPRAAPSPTQAPALTMPEPSGSTMGRDAPTEPLKQDSRKYDALAARGTPAEQQPASPAIRQLGEAGKAMADEGLKASEDSLAANADLSSRIVAARSNAWTQEEIDAAMNRVWYFVAPSAAASVSGGQSPATQPLFSPQGMGGALGGYGLVPQTGQAGAGLSADFAYGPMPSDKTSIAKNAPLNRFAKEAAAAAEPDLGKALSDEPARGRDRLSTAAGGATAAKVLPDAADGQTAAIGLGRLPAGQTASELLSRLQQQRGLQPLATASDSQRPALGDLDAVVKPPQSGVAASPAAGATAGVAGSAEQGQSPQAKTIVLFVSADEARQILQSLESQKAAAQASPQAELEKKDRAPEDLAKAERSNQADAGSLPPAWWVRPQALLQSGAVDAKAASEERVILILSQLPRG